MDKSLEQNPECDVRVHFQLQSTGSSQNRGLPIWLLSEFKSKRDVTSEHMLEVCSLPIRRDDIKQRAMFATFSLLDH